MIGQGPVPFTYRGSPTFSLDANCRPCVLVVSEGVGVARFGVGQLLLRPGQRLGGSLGEVRQADGFGHLTAASLCRRSYRAQCRRRVGVVEQTGRGRDHLVGPATIDVADRERSDRRRGAGGEGHAQACVGDGELQHRERLVEAGSRGVGGTGRRGDIGGRVLEVLARLSVIRLRFLRRRLQLADLGALVVELGDALVGGALPQGVELSAVHLDRVAPAGDRGVDRVRLALRAPVRGDGFTGPGLEASMVTDAIHGLLRPAAQLRSGVLAVGGDERVERPDRRGELSDVAAVLLELLERCRRVVDRRVGQLGQRVVEVLRQIDVDPVADTRVPHDVQQAEVLVEVGPSVQPAAQDASVCGSSVLGPHRIAADLGAELLRGQRGASAASDRLHEVEVDARSTVGHEPPVPHRVGVAVRLDPASERDVVLVACHLQPQVAGGLRFVAAREHPRAQHPRLFACRVDATHVRVEQERQQHVHRGRLARTVDAAQQEPTATEVQRLLAVLEHVDDAGPLEPPAIAHPGDANEAERSRRTPVGSSR